MSTDFVTYIPSELGVQPVPLQTITNENPAGPSLGTIPQARFLLVMLNMLTLQHGANNLSLLLNSGMLALTQTTLRLIGTKSESGSVLLGRNQIYMLVYPNYRMTLLLKSSTLSCLPLILLPPSPYPWKKRKEKRKWTVNMIEREVSLITAFIQLWFFSVSFCLGPYLQYFGSDSTPNTLFHLLYLLKPFPVCIFKLEASLVKLFTKKKKNLVFWPDSFSCFFKIGFPRQ